jgi:hypothetical protein
VNVTESEKVNELTVNELLAKYYQLCKRYYGDDGKRGGNCARVKRALSVPREVFGRQPVSEFSHIRRVASTMTAPTERRFIVRAARRESPAGHRTNYVTSQRLKSGNATVWKRPKSSWDTVTRRSRKFAPNAIWLWRQKWLAKLDKCDIRLVELPIIVITCVEMRRFCNIIKG